MNVTFVIIYSCILCIALKVLSYEDCSTTEIPQMHREKRVAVKL